VTRWGGLPSVGGCFRVPGGRSPFGSGCSCARGMDEYKASVSCPSELPVRAGEVSLRLEGASACREGGLPSVPVVPACRGMEEYKASASCPSGLPGRAGEVSLQLEGTSACREGGLPSIPVVFTCDYAKVGFFHIESIRRVRYNRFVSSARLFHFIRKQGLDYEGKLHHQRYCRHYRTV